MEACDTLLGLSLFGTDKDTTIKWVDVNMIRSRKLKSKSTIESMEGSSEDIFCPSMVDTHYPNRPEVLEDVSLFNFISKYDIVKIQPKSAHAVFFDYPGVGFIKQRAKPCLIKHKVFNISLEPEKYFYSLLLLFKPWREIEHLKGTYVTYADAFRECFDLIDSAMKHHDRLEYLRKSKEELAHAVEAAVSKEANEPIAVDQHLLMEAENAMGELRAANDDEPNSEELDALISNLNQDQVRVFNHIVSSFQSKDSSPLRHFISGVGGTGKSYVIKTIRAYVKCILGKDVAVTAPTGVAAHNIGGMTIHRLLQLPVEHGKTPEYKSLSSDVLKIIRDNMKSVILVIVDEISMVSNITLLYIHFRLAEVFNTTDESDGWFGRIHLIVFGDLLQLAPVMEEPPFKKVNQSTLDKCVSCIGTVDIWKEVFTYDELTINVRQNKDPEFANILSRARIGALNEQDVRLLNTRLIQFKSTTATKRIVELAKYVVDQDCLVILSTREHCRTLNTACLDQISTDEVISLADDSVDCAQSKKKKAQTKLTKLEEDPRRTAGLTKKLVLKKNCRVMLNRNFSISTGLVNGSLGTVDQFKYDPNGKLEFVRVKFGEYLHDVEKTLSKFEVFPGAYVYRKRFPLNIAYAITVHKCQGISIDTAILDIGQSIFTNGQSYVALSRVTTLKGLHLINFDPSICKASTDCIVEYNRLRNTYRSDLLPIALEQTVHNTKKDIVWKESKGNDFVDQEIVPQQNFVVPFPSFSNNDGVSCYANATIQALFISEPISTALLGLEQSNPLKMLALTYMSNVNTLNCHELRNEIGLPFTLQQQQNAGEFLLALFDKYPVIRNFVEVTLTTHVKCSACFDEFQRPDELHSSLSLPVDSNKTNMNKLLENYQSWSKIDGTTCTSCLSVGQQSQRIEIRTASQLLVLTINLWENQRKMTDLKINSLPTSIVRINNTTYILKSAIFHHGENMSSGHYTAMLKHGTNFYQANDRNLRQTRWPASSKDIYVIFLERKS